MNENNLSNNSCELNTWSSLSTDLNKLVGKINCNSNDLLTSKLQGNNSDLLTSKLQGTTASINLNNPSNQAVYLDPLTSLTSNFPPAAYYSNSILVGGDTWKLPLKDEVLEMFSSIFDRYGFKYNIKENVYNSSEERAISKKLKNDKIFGWICCGELNSIRLGSLLYPWDHVIPDLYIDPDIITLEISNETYFEDFSIRILLASHIVLVDSRGKEIINIIQDILLENLNKAFEDIQSELTKNSSGIYGYNDGYYSTYDLDTAAVKIDNNGHII